MNRYKKHKLITSLDELYKQELIINVNSLKPIHAGWFGSWQIRTAKNLINARSLYTAVNVQRSEGKLYCKYCEKDTYTYDLDGIKCWECEEGVVWYYL